MADDIIVPAFMILAAAAERLTPAQKVALRDLFAVEFSNPGIEAANASHAPRGHIPDADRFIERELLSAKEAADFLRSSESTLAKHRVSGNGPRYAKVGRRVVYRRGDLQAFVDDRQRKSTSEPAKTASSANGIGAGLVRSNGERRAGR